MKPSIWIEFQPTNKLFQNKTTDWDISICFHGFSKKEYNSCLKTLGLGNSNLIYSTVSDAASLHSSLSHSGWRWEVYLTSQTSDFARFSLTSNNKKWLIKKTIWFFNHYRKFWLSQKEYFKQIK